MLEDMKWGVGVSLFEINDTITLLKNYPFIKHIQIKLPSEIQDVRLRLKERIELIKTELPQLSISFHAFPLINLCESVYTVRQQWVKLAQEALQCCWENGGEYVVFHAGYAQGSAVAQKRKKALLMLVDSLDELIEIATDLDVSIHMENIYPAPFRSELIRVLDRKEDYEYLEENIQDKALCYCFDYGHAIIDDRGLDIYHQIQGKIQSIHLHDNDRTNDEHIAIGDNPTNTLAWEREINKIYQSGFDGYLILENSSKELENALDYIARIIL